MNRRGTKSHTFAVQGIHPFLLLCLITVFALVGCQSDDSQDPTPTSNADEYSGYLMVRFATPDFISDIQASISPDDLYDDGELHSGIQEVSHITLMSNLRRDVDLTALRSFLAPLSTYTATLTSVSMFYRDDFDVLIATVESAQFQETHETIMRNFENTYPYSNYNMHMTIAYLKKGCVQKYVSMQPSVPVAITPEAFFFSYTDDNGQKIPEIYFTE